MDAYPQDLIAKSYPLIALSGFETEDGSSFTQEHALQHNGIKIGSDGPPIYGSRAQDLSVAFVKLDESNLKEGYETTLAQRQLLFRFRVCGRRYSLPVHKASPQPSPADSPIEVSSPTSSYGAALHSPLSPLSPGSPLHPDGLMTPLWNEKHQRVIPCVFIAFFQLSSDPSSNENRDNELKSEIAALKTSIEQSRYRIRLAVVLVGDESTGSAFNASDLDDRIEGVKKSARLDSSNAFYLPVDTPGTELVSFASSVLSSLRPQCTEYYRDLTRHARRKRDKGASSSFASWNMRSSSQGLPKLAWICRYEYKLGIFAEFRNEMDVAERHYAAAWDALCDSQGPFETLSNWSPRWDEARMLADAASIRLIRCQLSTGLTNSAVKTWRNHQHKMRDLMSRKGKGTSNYGWEAWEARWHKVMALLALESDNFIKGRRSIDSGSGTEDKTAKEVFAPRERFIQPDQALDPWENLHHVGYWFSLSAEHVRQRRELAQAIPEEDRTPPGRSPASQVARRGKAYDTYLCPPPHEEFQMSPGEENIHALEMITTLGRATLEFSNRDQHRMADYLRVGLCQELMGMGKYQEAFSLLRPMWTGNRWRQEQWWPLVQEVSHTLYDCATALSHEALRIGTLWELSSSVFNAFPDVKYDLSTLTHEIASDTDRAKSRNVLRLNNENMVSCCSVSCVFEGTEADASDPVTAQIALKSQARPESAPIQFSRVLLEFEGILDSIDIQHTDFVAAGAEDRVGSSSLQTVKLADVSSDHERSRGSVLSGRAGLRLAPGETIVLNMEVTPLETGEIINKSASLILKERELEVHFSSQMSPEPKTPAFWWSADAQNAGMLRRSAKPGSSRLSIHPRPPKLQVSLANVQEIFYTNEEPVVNIELLNEEDEEAHVQLQVRALSDENQNASLVWTDQEPTSQEPASEHTHFLECSIGKLAPSSSKAKQLSIALPSAELNIVLEARVTYRLPRNPELPVSKLATTELPVMQPFSATYRIRPGLHTNPWPSYFDIKTMGRPIRRWHFDVLFSCAADEALNIDALTLNVDNIDEGVKCWVSDQSENCRQHLTLHAKEQRWISFVVDMEQDYDDTRDPALRPALKVDWRRTDRKSPEIAAGSDHATAAATVHSVLELPVVTLVTHEPRVLASARRVPRSAIHLQKDSTQTIGDPDHPTKTEARGQADALSQTSLSSPAPAGEQKEDASSAISLHLYLENPSSQLLTFAISMDPSDEYAFSGHQSVSVNILPKMRHQVKHVLLPLEKTSKWVKVGVKVVDVEFKKVMDVRATGKNLKEGRGKDRGLWVWMNDA